MRFPIRYLEPAFHPPSEAASPSLPVTDSCSRNRRTICAIYSVAQIRFRARTEFRGDHALNWPILKDRLNAGKERLLAPLRTAMEVPQAVRLRPALARGL